MLKNNSFLPQNLQFLSTSSSSSPTKKKIKKILLHAGVDDSFALQKEK